MLEIIKALLKEEDVTIYNVEEINTKSYEMFFIRKSLDMTRMKNVVKYILTVYVKNEDYLGQAVCKITPDMSKDEIKQKIQDTKFAASLVKDKYFDIPDKAVDKIVLDNISLQEMAKKVADTFLSFSDEKTFINSFEIFSSKICTRIINSNGSDIYFEQFKINGEYITQSVVETDVELYNEFCFYGENIDTLKNDITNALKRTSLRSIAKPTLESGNFDILLSDKNMKEIFSYYLEKTDAGYIYNNYSDYKIGEDTKHNVSIKALPLVPYSSDGILMKEITLLDEGICKNFTGSTRFCRYLNLQPTGTYEKVYVKEGNLEKEKINDTYLEVLEFSDLQMDSLAGQFKGEIRLAVLHKDGKEIPVTGGSINGSIIDNSFELSKSRIKYCDYDGPEFILFKGVNVAGN